MCGKASGDDAKPEAEVETNVVNTTKVNDSDSPRELSEGEMLLKTVDKPSDVESHALVESKRNDIHDSVANESIRTSLLHEPDAPLLSRLAVMAEAEVRSIRRKLLPGLKKVGRVRRSLVTPSLPYSTIDAETSEEPTNKLVRTQSETDGAHDDRQPRPTAHSEDEKTKTETHCRPAPPSNMWISRGPPPPPPHACRPHHHPPYPHPARFHTHHHTYFNGPPNHRPPNRLANECGKKQKTQPPSPLRSHLPPPSHYHHQHPLSSHLIHGPPRPFTCLMPHGRPAPYTSTVYRYPAYPSQVTSLPHHNSASNPTKPEVGEAQSACKDRCSELISTTKQVSNELCGSEPFNEEETRVKKRAKTEHSLKSLNVGGQRGSSARKGKRVGLFSDTTDFLDEEARDRKMLSPMKKNKNEAIEASEIEASAPLEGISGNREERRVDEDDSNGSSQSEKNSRHPRPRKKSTKKKSKTVTPSPRGMGPDRKKMGDSLDSNQNDHQSPSPELPKHEYSERAQSNTRDAQAPLSFRSPMVASQQHPNRYHHMPPHYPRPPPRRDWGYTCGPYLRPYHCSTRHFHRPHPLFQIPHHHLPQPCGKNDTSTINAGGASFIPSPPCPNHQSVPHPHRSHYSIPYGSPRQQYWHHRYRPHYHPPHMGSPHNHSSSSSRNGATHIYESSKKKSIGGSANIASEMAVSTERAEGCGTSPKKLDDILIEASTASESRGRCIPICGQILANFSCKIRDAGNNDEASHPDAGADDTSLPSFHQLVNFPDYLPKKTPSHQHEVEERRKRVTASESTTKCCVMCGTSCVFFRMNLHRDEEAPLPNGSVPGALEAGGAEALNTTTFIIPRQNKGLCTSCDVKIWLVQDMDLTIKWCKGCKNFRSWSSFGEKSLATKCVKCRDRQKEKYASQKEGLRVKRQIDSEKVPSFVVESDSDDNGSSRHDQFCNTKNIEESSSVLYAALGLSKMMTQTLM